MIHRVHHRFLLNTHEIRNEIHATIVVVGNYDNEIRKIRQGEGNGNNACVLFHYILQEDGWHCCGTPEIAPFQNRLFNAVDFVECTRLMEMFSEHYTGNMPLEILDNPFDLLWILHQDGYSQMTRSGDGFVDIPIDSHLNQIRTVENIHNNPVDMLVAKWFMRIYGQLDR